MKFGNILGRRFSWPQVFLQGFFAVLRIRICDPVPFYPWIRDPGWVESQHPEIRDEQPGSYFLELKNHCFGFFGVKILKFFDADPGSGMETIRIRDRKSRIRDPG
jgi:hypothetical protein